MRSTNKIFSIFTRDLFLFCSNLITGIIIARTLGPHVLGIWSILSIMPAFAENFGRIKVDLAAVYFIGKNIFSKRSIYININIIALTMSSIILVFTYIEKDIISKLLFGEDWSIYLNHISIMLINIPLQFLYLNHVYYHLACDNLTVYNRMTVIQAIVNSSVSITLIFIYSLGIWSVIIGAIVSSFLALLYGFVNVERVDKVSAGFDLKVTISLIRKGFVLYISGIFTQGMQTGSQIFAVKSIIPANMAFLQQGLGLGRILGKFIDPVNTILYPRLSRNDEIDSSLVSCKAFRVTLILMLFFGGGLFISVTPLVTILYGSDYKPVADMVYYLLPGFVIGGPASTLVNYFLGIGKSMLILYVQFFSLLLQLFIAWQLIPLYGVQAAALSISVGAVAYSTLLILVFIHSTSVRIRDLVPYAEDYKVIYSFLVTKLKLRKSI